MSKLESRRTFLKKTGLSLSGLAFLSLAGCSQTASSSSSSAVPASSEPAAEAVAADAEIEIPSHPYPSCEFDLDRVEQLAYESFYQNGCCYAVTNALLTELKEKVGFPYTAIPAEMFVNGKTGYGASSLCGSLGGAAAVIGLMCSPDDSSAITKELFNWYTSTNLPIYQPEIQAETPTVAKTVNCADSVTTFMAAAGITEMSDPRRLARCGGVSADVARKTAELLNIHFGYMEAEAAPAENAPEETLADNEYIGEGEGFGGTIRVKVTMDGDQISKIEVLSHGETAGVSDPAFETIPDAIIAAQSTEVDAAAGATFSSKGIMEAVNDALSKIGT